MKASLITHLKKFTVTSIRSKDLKIFFKRIRHVTKHQVTINIWIPVLCLLQIFEAIDQSMYGSKCRKGPNKAHWANMNLLFYKSWGHTQEFLRAKKVEMTLWIPKAELVCNDRWPSKKHSALKFGVAFVSHAENLVHLPLKGDPLISASADMHYCAREPSLRQKRHWSLWWWIELKHSVVIVPEKAHSCKYFFPRHNETSHEGMWVYTTMWRCCWWVTERLADLHKPPSVRMRIG